MPDRQLTLDFDRGAQLRMLQECQLPSLTGTDGRSVAQSTAKLVLHIIDHHGRGRTAFLSHDRLAAQCQRNRRTTIRAIQALEHASLLCVERDGRRNCNRYTIVWSELGLLCPAPTSARAGTRDARKGSPNRQCPAPPSPSAWAGTRHQCDDGPTRTVTERSATNHPTPHKICDTRTGQSDTRTGQSDTGVTLSVFEAQEEPPPPTPPETTWESAAAELESLGVERLDETLRAARRRGLTPGDILDEAKTAKYNARRFQSVPRALVARLKSGHWPAEGVQHWKSLLPTRQRTNDKRRCEEVVADAWRQLRKQTAIGQCVDDDAWYELALQMGAPQDYVAARFCRKKESEGTP